MSLPQDSNGPHLGNSQFWRRLYVRIWLAVIVVVAILTILVGWVWRMTAEQQPRDMVVRDAAGQVVGHGQLHIPKPGEHPLPPDRAGAEPDTSGVVRAGPEFVLHMTDGQVFAVQLPPRRESPPRWGRWPFGFVPSLVLIGLAVALATYPILRRLTQRLEQLRRGVEKWGAGDLSVRVGVHGGDEVAFLAERFNDAAQRIEGLVDSHKSLLTQQQALLQSQKALLANASHELRSPLARIRMGMELLGDSAEAKVRDELSRNIAELDQLIEEILLASRLDAGEADLGTIEPVDLVGLAAEECARTGAYLDVVSQAQSGDQGLMVLGVSRLLRRLLRNLLENARRYGAGDVVVSLQTLDRQVVLSVCDRGPGVPQALRERIFEPFYRLPGASEREGGVGLGLSLVKSIAQRHHGSVRCDDHAGGGACFIVELPQQ